MIDSNYPRTFSHIGITVPDIQKPYKMVYVEDPFGIVFEIYTHSYELTYSSGAYQD